MIQDASISRVNGVNGKWCIQRILMQTRIRTMDRMSGQMKILTVSGREELESI